MKISELINLLQEDLKTYGDLTVCIAEEHEYWGELTPTVYSTRIDNHAQPHGPKSGLSEKALVFITHYLE